MINLIYKLFIQTPISFFFCILGFITSIPIFVNINSLNILKINFLDKSFIDLMDLIIFKKKIIIDGIFIVPPITTGHENIHLPIGLFAILIIYFYLFIYLKNKTFISIIITISFSFIVYILKDIGFFRAVSFGFSLLFISLSLIIMSNIKVTDTNYKNMKLFFLFYFLGLLIFLLSNIISVLYAETVQQGYYPALRFHHIFFYEIYQYYISFNAVISFLLAISFFILLINVNNFYNFSFSFLMILSSIVLVFCLRKITIIDLFVLYLFSLYFIFFYKHNKIKKFNNWIINIFLLSSLVTTTFFVFKIRQITSFSSMIVDRLFNLYTFLNEVNTLNTKQLLFGYSKGFGGYSNLFLDLFVRVGFLGLTIFSLIVITLLFLIFKYIIFNNKNILYLNNNLTYFFYGYLAYFITMGNLTNLNLFVPYYYVNISIGILFFNYVNIRYLRKIPS